MDGVFPVPPGCLPQGVSHAYLSESLSTGPPRRSHLGSGGDVGIGRLKSKGAPGPVRSSSEASLALPAEAPAFVLAVLSYSPASGALLPRPGWLPLLLGSLASGKPVLLPEGSLISQPLASAVGPCG